MSDRPETHAIADPHADAAVLRDGAPIEAADAVVVLLHGRGGSAGGMLDLARALGTGGVAWLAPEAVGNSWYPLSFLAPIRDNEPWLSSALALVDRIVTGAAQAGHPAERIAVGGFSQGACLASEYAARNARRYGALLLFSGGLIGPPGTAREYRGSFEGTPVLLGCSDVDPHIPVERVRETSRVLAAMGAVVDERIYPGLGHTIVEDEVAAAAALLEDLVAGRRAPRPRAGP